jgi:hypothetical protein
MVETRNEIERQIQQSQIERHIQQTRNELSENVNELEGRVKNVVNWRAQVEERPATMMAVAFGTGVLLSALLPPVRLPRGRSSTEGWTASANGGSGSSLPWNALKGALIGVATAKLSSFIEDILPGFEQEFAKAKHSSRQDLAPYGSD